MISKLDYQNNKRFTVYIISIILAVISMVLMTMYKISTGGVVIRAIVVFAAMCLIVECEGTKDTYKELDFVEKLSFWSLGFGLNIFGFIAAASYLITAAEINNRLRISGALIWFFASQIISVTVDALKILTGMFDEDNTEDEWINIDDD